jgi:hypothetical protein
VVDLFRSDDVIYDRRHCFVSDRRFFELFRSLPGAIRSVVSPSLCGDRRRQLRMATTTTREVVVNIDLLAMTGGDGCWSVRGLTVRAAATEAP